MTTTTYKINLSTGAEINDYGTFALFVTVEDEHGGNGSWRGLTWPCSERPTRDEIAAVIHDARVQRHLGKLEWTIDSDGFRDSYGTRDEDPQYGFYTVAVATP